MKPLRDSGGYVVLATTMLVGVIGGIFMLAQQQMLSNGMNAQRHLTLRDDISAIRRHIIHSLDCTNTLAEGIPLGTTTSAPIPNPMTGNHCDLTSSSRMLLTLRDRNNNPLTAALETAAGDTQNTGRVGDWVILSECDHTTNHSLVIRAARNEGTGFLEDPLTKRRYDFSSNPLYLFGGPTTSQGAQRICQESLGGGAAPGLVGAIPRWESPSTFASSLLFQDPNTSRLGFNTATPEVGVDFNLDGRQLKFRNESNASEISIEGRATGLNSNAASLDFINPTTGVWWHQTLRGDTGDLEFHFRPTGTTGIENRNLMNPTFKIRFLSASGEIQSNGYQLNSDRRLKRDIENLTPELLDRLAQLRGVTFRWKNGSSDRKVMGFIAQEVAKFFPDLVSKDENGLYRVNYDGLLPLLVEAYRQQRREIERITARVEALEERLARLESMP